MPQMTGSWPTMIWAPSPLCHFISLFSAKTGLITVPAAAIIHSPSSCSSLIGASTGLIHTDWFAQKFFPVKALNGCLGLRLGGHFYKTEPSGLTTVLVFDHSR